jgi:hypothetical protein
VFFCFNCDGVGHIEHEFPYPKIEIDDTEEEEESMKKNTTLK